MAIKCPSRWVWPVLTQVRQLPTTSNKRCDMGKSRHSYEDGMQIKDHRRVGQEDVEIFERSVIDLSRRQYRDRELARQERRRQLNTKR